MCARTCICLLARVCVHLPLCMCRSARVHLFCARMREFTRAYRVLASAGTSRVCVRLRSRAGVCVRVCAFASVRACARGRCACAHPCVRGRVNARVCAFFPWCATMPGIIKRLGKNRKIANSSLANKDKVRKISVHKLHNQAIVLVP